MSSKVSIDRDFLESIRQYLIETESISNFGAELFQLLNVAAPVVERQPVRNASEVAYNLQAELAELQATIARLKGGQVEPVAWIKPKTLEALTPSGMVYVTGFDIGGSIALYTSQPTPVSVVLPEWKDTVQMDGYQSPWDAGWNACLDKVKELNYQGHASDCSTNNRGVPELLGPCDCELSRKPQ